MTYTLEWWRRCLQRSLRIQLSSLTTESSNTSFMWNISFWSLHSKRAMWLMSPKRVVALRCPFSPGKSCTRSWGSTTEEMPSPSLFHQQLIVAASTKFIISWRECSPRVAKIIKNILKTKKVFWGGKHRSVNLDKPPCVRRQIFIPEPISKSRLPI